MEWVFYIRGKSDARHFNEKCTIKKQGQFMVKTNEMSKLDSSIQYPLLINTNQKFVKKKNSALTIIFLHPQMILWRHTDTKKKHIKITFQTRLFLIFSFLVTCNIQSFLFTSVRTTPNLTPKWQTAWFCICTITIYSMIVYDQVDHLPILFYVFFFFNFIFISNALDAHAIKLK